MIIVVANTEYDRVTNTYKLVTSHGIDFETLEHVVLQPVHPTLLGAVLDRELGEYVIK